MSDEKPTRANALRDLRDLREMKPGPWERLLGRASQLGINTTGMTPIDGRRLEALVDEAEVRAAADRERMGARGEVVTPQVNDDVEAHQAVFREALAKYIEREETYHGLWKESGAADNASHLKSKAQRVRRTLSNQFGVAPVESGSAQTKALLDDAIDAINYAAFVIRNVRAGRMGDPEDAL